MPASVVYVTFPNRDEALALAGTLVEERLVACANVLDGVTSLYRWEGAVHHDPEVVLIAKTRTSLVERTIARVRELHSYDQPCVTSWPITAADPGYLAWIGAETGEVE